MPPNPIVTLMAKELSVPAAGAISAGALARRLVKSLDAAGYAIVRKPDTGQ